MSELKTLSVQKRSAFGKGANRRLRVKALVPGVFYASDGTNVPGHFHCHIPHSTL